MQNMLDQVSRTPRLWNILRWIVEAGRTAEISATRRVAIAEGIERNERFGTPDYLNWSVTLAREVAYGVTVTLGYYDTNIRRAECVGGQKICDARAMLTISRTF